jgi:hypothetical protein
MNFKESSGLFKMYKMVQESKPYTELLNMVAEMDDELVKL